MSPVFVNDNSHPVRVDDGSGALERVLAGGTVEADGKFADNLTRTAGVRPADDDEAGRHYEAHEPAADAVNHDLAVGTAATRLRTLATALTVVGPLQRVIGDDQAPYGPPSGTVTTKQAVARQAVAAGDERTREAFADHDALHKVPGADPVDLATQRTSQPPNSAQVHNAQAAAEANAEAAADLYIDPSGLDDLTGSGADSVLGGDDDDSTDELAPGSDYNAANKLQLQAEAARRGLDVEGTGADGAVVKSDLVGALNANDAARGTSDAT